MPFLNLYPTLGGVQRCRWVDKCLTSLNNCSCLAYWKDYTDKALECGRIELSINRLILCLQQQCWSDTDIDTSCFTEADRDHVFPTVVSRALSCKLKALRELKRSKAKASGDARRLLVGNHDNCGPSKNKFLKGALEATRFLVRTQEKSKTGQVNDEISELISRSNWQKIVDTSRVLNLTTGELNDIELEVLSLGLNFKLQGTNSTIIGTFEGFEDFEKRYLNSVSKPSLTMVRKDTLLSLKTAKVEILPLRYTNALKSIRANKNVRVLLSDKGKRTVVCYSTTYETLLSDHYSNTTLYQPVEESDKAGHDLDTMSNELNVKLNILIKNTKDEDTKKIIKSLKPPVNPRFPQGRVSLKVHKEGVTQTNIPVRPIVSNTNSPTSNLAAYLGKHLTKQLGEVSEKHVRSVEEFATCMKDCTVEGRLLSLDVINLFTCIPIPKAIEFLRNTSNGWGAHPPKPCQTCNTS